MNRELPDVQAGFGKGRGIRDPTVNIHWLIKKAREFQKNIPRSEARGAVDPKAAEWGARLPLAWGSYGDMQEGGQGSVLELEPPGRREGTAAGEENQLRGPGTREGVPWRNQPCRRPGPSRTTRQRLAV